MKRITILIMTLATMAPIGKAMASCECRCIDGEAQAVCSSSLEVGPICSSRICPTRSPSVAPTERPRVPPTGTSRCTQQQVYNEYLRKYEWKEICR